MSELVELKKCPKYLVSFTFGITLSFKTKSGTLKLQVLFDLKHMTALLFALKVISCSTPYFSHSPRSVCKPLYEGDISTKSSAYKRWFTIKAPTTQPMYMLFNFSLKSSM